MELLEGHCLLCGPVRKGGLGKDQKMDHLFLKTNDQDRGRQM